MPLKVFGPQFHHHRITGCERTLTAPFTAQTFVGDDVQGIARPVGARPVFEWHLAGVK